MIANLAGSGNDRIADLESHIFEIRKLLKQYEDNTYLASDPAAKLFAEKQIPNLKEKLREFEEELRNERSKLASTPIQEEQTTVPSQILGSIETSLQEIKHDVQMGISKVLSTQDTILGRLDVSDQLMIGEIQSAIQNGGIPDKELSTTIEVIERAIQTFQEHRESYNSEILTTLQKMEESLTLSSQMGLQHKLEVTIPIIPTILSYKTELSAGNTIDLDATWEELRGRWKALILRTSHKIWTPSMVSTYGKIISQENGIEDSALIDIARESFQNLYTILNNVYDYLTDFKTRLERGSNNPKMFLNGQSKVDELTKRVHSLHGNISILANMTGNQMLYPIPDLLRLQELTANISTNLKLAATQSASLQSTTKTADRIKRELLTTLRILEKFLSWLRNTIKSFQN